MGARLFLTFQAWVESLDGLNQGLPLSISRVTILPIDASNKSCGDAFFGTVCPRIWIFLVICPLNYMELMAEWEALRGFSPVLKGNHVQPSPNRGYKKHAFVMDCGRQNTMFSHYKPLIFWSKDNDGNLSMSMFPSMQQMDAECQVS